MAEYLADLPVENQKEEAYDFPDEQVLATELGVWTMYFDGASNQKGFGIGVLLVSPDGDHIPISVKLDFEVTNNAAEYEACLIGLQAAKSIKIKELRVYGDSSLIINQVSQKWRVRSEALAPYQSRLIEMTRKFREVTFAYLPRDENQFADALAKLASMINIPEDTPTAPITIERRHQPAYCNALEIDTVEAEPWYKDIQHYIRHKEYPPNSDARAQRALRTLASHYFENRGELYKKTDSGISLLCISKEQANVLLEELHGGECGPHMNGRALYKMIQRMGYYWSTMEGDCHKFVRKCHKCQIYANLQHQPPSYLYTLTSPWPFSIWGIDIIGKITPKGTGGHEYVLVAVDYFTKWVEAASYAKITAKHVAKFIISNIICQYGIPHEMISDQGSHFKAEVEELFEKYKIQHHQSSPYRPQANRAVEAVNKTITTIIEKMATNYRDWPNKLHFALWGYRTSIRTATGATPYSLVYGTEAVLPAEIAVPSLRIVAESEIPEADWAKARYDELVGMDERRLKALHNIQQYQKRIAKAFNKKVKPRDIKEGDLVLKQRRAPIQDPRGKFRPNWEGPFIVKSITPRGAVRLVKEDGVELYNYTNLDQLKRYYA